MKLSPSGLMDHARSDEGRKQLRYAGISVVFVPVGQVFVQVLHFATDIPDYLCILISAAVLTLPNYWANKRFVWRDGTRDPGEIRTQITVFWVAAMLGTGFAMGLAALADHLTRNSGKVWQSAWLFIAQLSGYGIVWVARYFVLDKWIFKVTHDGEEPTEEELEELHHEFPI